MVNIRKNYLNYEWISQPRSGGGFWYIPIRELKKSTYWVEIEKR